MDNSNVIATEDNQVNGEKPPPRVCPRCTSENTKFCYYNNYSVSQPCYNCKNCRRYWTHGGALRNIPIGGSCRKVKRTRIEPPSVNEVVSVEIQQMSHHKPCVYVQETNKLLGSFGGFIPSAIVGNHNGSLHERHDKMVENATPIQSFRPLEALDFIDGSFRRDYFDVGSIHFVRNSLINQSFGGSITNHNKWNRSFNNTMNMNHNGNTGRNIRSSSSEMYKNKIINNSVISCHLEKDGP